MRNDASFVFAERLRALRKSANLSHKRLSKALEMQYGVKISADSLMNYEVTDEAHTKARKNLGMRVEYLLCLADYFDVSIDYLLGRSDLISQREDIQVACATTGLSEKAVTYLRGGNEIRNLPPKKSKRLSILSDLIEQDGFDAFLSHIEKCVFEMQLKSQTEYSGSADYLEHKGELLKHGYVILPARVQAQARFNEELIIRLRTLLRNIAAERAQKDHEAEEFQEGFEMLKVDESELPKEIKKATGGNR